MTLSVETCIAQHQGDREEQQDRVALFAHPKRSGMLLAVLADGMGGHSGGAMAAEQVLLTARNNFDTYGPAQSVREMLAEGINDAHSAIRLTRYTSEQDPHSTACIFIMHGQRADWAHCGDSRIYHFRNGELVSRTIDHSYVADLLRQGMISAAEIPSHPHKNYLLSCLGEMQPPQISFGQASELTPGDCFLLCSDGLWNYCSDAEFAGALAQHAPRAAAAMLIEMARRRGGGGGDNISVAIVRVVGPAKAVKPKIAQAPLRE